MKKLILLTLAFVVSGCSVYRDNIAYTTDRPTVKIETSIKPTVTIGKEVSGKALCSDAFFIFHNVPSEQTYGATINAEKDIVPDSECAAAAVYDALNNSHDADVLVAPRFTSINKSFLCLPLIGCLMKTQDIYVQAHEGKISYTNSK